MIKLTHEKGMKVYVRASEIVLLYEGESLTRIVTSGAGVVWVKEPAEKIMEAINAL